MPNYEYECCGVVFESFRSDKCPLCGESGKRLISHPARIISRSSESLPLGNKSRGRYIPPSNGRSSILIPSYGLLEKEEVDYLAEGMIEKENTRVRHSQNKENVQMLSTIARQTKKGQRAKAIDEVLGGSK